MNQRLIRALLGTLLTVGIAAIAVPAVAYQKGDILLRAGAAGVFPTGESDNIPTFPAGSKVEADDAWSLGLTFAYMITDNVGIEVLGAYPFKHDIKATGTISQLGTVGEAKQLPPTVSLQYYFDTDTKFTPYVGAGINYTYFFSEDTKGALNGLDLDLDSSWGLAGQAGVDYELDNNWLLNAAVWYIDIDTNAKVTGVPSFDVEIDPWVFMVGVGKKF